MEIYNSERPFWMWWSKEDRGWIISHDPCSGCKIGPPMSDDKGACFGKGWLCPTCGYYRSLNPLNLKKE